MDLLRDNEPIYMNGLEIKRFSKMLDDPTQCYKFYWFEAIMNLFKLSSEDILFDDIFNEMIYAAWYSVTESHLSLGPKVNGAPVNLLERAIDIIGNCSEHSSQGKRQMEEKNGKMRKEEILILTLRMENCMNSVANRNIDLRPNET